MSVQVQCTLAKQLSGSKYNKYPRMKYVKIPTAHSPQPTAHSPQPTAHSPQPTAHSPQPTAFNNLPQQTMSHADSAF
ncbi:Hypothetical protein HDN1F_15950 [gamma proteobacterium HdN1]|nr:Hypothetical protein HDN1F_15950 [gamma proteobacterium HdN1]